MQAIRTTETKVVAFNSQADSQERYPGELLHLRAQAEQMDQLLELLPSGLVILNGDGQVVQSNSAAVQLLGQELDGLAWRQVVEQAFSPQADDGHELSLTNGRRVKLSISTLGDQPGQLILITDLTQTRQLQTRIAQMQRLSALGKMVASLAHQIRTPLSAALLYGGNLTNKALPEAARGRFVGKMMARMKDLETQVNDMLLFAKSGDQQIVEPISLQALLSQVKDHSEALVERGLCQLKLQLPDPDLLILANSNALSSAISNLIDNAVKAYSNDMSYSRHIYLSAFLTEQQEVCIEVADDGPGIDAELHSKVIEPFYTTRSQGTGLGLAVVHAVAKSHKGYLGLKSEPGKGSRFHIFLPLTQVEHNAELQQAGGHQ